MVMVCEWYDIVFFIQSSKTSRKIVKNLEKNSIFSLLPVCPWQRMTSDVQTYILLQWHIAFVMCVESTKNIELHIFRKFEAKKASYRLKPFDTTRNIYTTSIGIYKQMHDIHVFYFSPKIVLFSYLTIG